MKSLLITSLVIFACSDHSYSQPAHLWTRTVHGFNVEGTLDIATDHDGNVFATGYFMSTATAESPDTSVTFTAADDKDIFLVKFSPSGDLLWAHSFGGDFDDLGNALATDDEGNVYMAGFIEDDADFDPSPETAFLLSAGLQDVFLVKYDPDGNFVWGFTLGNMFTDQGKDLIFDDGYLYLTGGFRMTVDFDPGAGITELTSTSSTTDIFFAKYTPDAELVWAKRMGGFQTDNVEAMAVKTSGVAAIYLTGGFDVSIELDPLGGATHTSAGSTDIFIASYDTAGNYQWSYDFGSSSYDMSRDVATDQEGNVYITGHFWNTVNFSTTGGTLEVESNGQSDIYLAKFDPAGNDEWALSAGAGDADIGLSIAASGSGEVYISGSFGNAADFDPGPDEFIVESGGFYNAFLAGYSTDGVFDWAGNFDSPSTGYGRALTTDDFGQILTGGEFEWATDFDISGGEYFVGNDGGYDAYITKYGECLDVNTTIAETICNGETYLFDGDILTTSGIYNASFANIDGCDSLVTLELTVTLVDTSVTVTATDLSANADAAVYQWIDCDNSFEPVAGATDQIFTPPATGNYAVVVTMAGCTDTSACHLFKETNNTVADIDQATIAIYPNPADELIHVVIDRQCELSIYNISGERIFFNSFAPGIEVIATETFAPGIYLLQLTGSDVVSGSGALFEIK